MNDKNIKKVIYRPFPIFYAIAFGPIVVTLITIAIFYINHHNIPNKLPMISHAAADLPESRVFRMGIIFTSWFMFAAFLIIDRALKVLNRRAHNAKSPSVQFSRYMMKIFDGLAFFGLIGACSITIKSNSILHTISVVMFIISITFSYIFMDYLLAKSRTANYQLLSIYTFTPPVMLLIGTLIIKFAANKYQIYNFGIILQYFGCTMIFLKFILIIHIIPSFNIEFSEKDTKAF